MFARGAWLKDARVNTKATLRIYIKNLLPLVPKLLHPEIERSRYHARNSQSLVIHSDGSRTQAANIQECYKKLHAAIVAAGRATVKGETSPEKVEKIRNLYVVFISVSHCFTNATAWKTTQSGPNATTG